MEDLRLTFTLTNCWGMRLNVVKYQPLQFGPGVAPVLEMSNSRDRFSLLSHCDTDFKSGSHHWLLYEVFWPGVQVSIQGLLETSSTKHNFRLTGPRIIHASLFSNSLFAFGGPRTDMVTLSLSKDTIRLKRLQKVAIRIVSWLRELTSETPFNHVNLFPMDSGRVCKDSVQVTESLN